MQDPAEPWARIYAEDWLKPIDLDAVFGNSGPIEIDLGSGKGRFLLARAAAHPAVNFLGIERMLSRVRAVVHRIERRGLRNCRLLRMEGYYAMRYLVPPGRIAAVYVFFPDPWPKARHHRHRVFSPAFLDALHDALAPGGVIHAATDHLPYHEEICRLLAADPRFEAIPAFVPDEHERTDFERYYVRHSPIGRISVRKRPPVDGVGAPESPEASPGALTDPDP